MGGILASGLELLGFRLRHRLNESLGVVDGMGGAVLVACLGLGLVWVAGAVALHTPGAPGLREPIQRSSVLTRLNEMLPPSGPLLQALARFDPFPTITGPDPGVSAPDSAIARDPEVRAAGRGVVRVLGTACGLGVQGSGWVAADGVVVTNAHVVAGQSDTSVQLGGRGERLDAQAIHFDVKNDLAVLRVPGVSGVRPLAMNEGARPGHRRRRAGLSRERPLRRGAGPRRRHEHRAQPGRLRPRPGPAPDHRPARPGAVGQLGRSRRGRAGPGGHHHLRRRAGVGQRKRVRGPGLDRARGAEPRRRAGAPPVRARADATNSL